MTKFLKYFFEKWWLPIIFLVITCALFGLSEILNSHFFGSISILLSGIGLLSILISSIYQLFNKKWFAGIISFIIFGGTICLFIFYFISVFLVTQLKPDTFADNLTIPSDISIDMPLNLDFNGQRPDSIIDIKVVKTDFQLYNSFQPGLYEYDFWTKNIEKGIIYLKAFEITKEYALSTSSLSERSSVEINNPTDTIMVFGTNSDFTIYEGEWGKPYAARFEVWFNPDNGDKEHKIFEKNYIIEGWMR